jgi:ParB family chromosome partitioning protein
MEVLSLRISQIEPDRNQPRKYFNESALVDLSISISENGVIEPIIVKPIGRGFYRIIAGERRWRASRMANLTEIPSIVMENISDLDAFKLSFNENLQRESLTPIEEALGYVKLIDEFGLTHDEVAQATGRARPTITNMIRLLNLEPKVQDMVAEGKLPVAHAKYILSADGQYQEQLAEMVVEQKLSIKQLDFEIKKLHSEPRPTRNKLCDSYFKEVELSLCNAINRPVKVTGTEKNGYISINFYSKDDLTNIANALAHALDEEV